GTFLRYLTATSNGYDELDFVMQVGSPLRIGNHRVTRHDGISGLAEEDRSSALRVRAHFPRMVGVVAADAVDAMDGKALAAAGDRDARHRSRREGNIGHQESLQGARKTARLRLHPDASESATEHTRRDAPRGG